MILYEAPDLDQVAIRTDKETKKLQITFSELAYGKTSPKLAMSMKGALYCRKYGLDPVTVPMAELSDTNEKYRTFRNTDIPLFPKEETQSCFAVETERGVVLFSDAAEGFNGYLQYLTDKFYDPDFGVNTLRLYELDIPTAKVPEGIDRCFDYDTPG